VRFAAQRRRVSGRSPARHLGQVSDLRFAEGQRQARGRDAELVLSGRRLDPWFTGAKGCTERTEEGGRSKGCFLLFGSLKGRAGSRRTTHRTYLDE
jgi:hypothetical protein